jgi:DNA-binding PadR family transcriptional regulator
MSLKHATLGFLSYMPLSGYDLKRAFDGSVRHFWPADQAQIYRTLAQLADEGLVERETVTGEKQRERHVYHITAAGRAELRQWLATPQPPSEDREPFLIQVFFAANLAPEESLRILEGQRDELRQQYAFYEALFARLASGSPADSGAPDKRSYFHTTLTLEYVLSIGHGYLRWLDAAIDRVQREDYTPLHPDNYPRGDEQ